jgi:hypothetical protein
VQAHVFVDKHPPSNQDVRDDATPSSTMGGRPTNGTTPRPNPKERAGEARFAREGMATTTTLRRNEGQTQKKKEATATATATATRITFGEQGPSVRGRGSEQRAAGRCNALARSILDDGRRGARDPSSGRSLNDEWRGCFVDGRNVAGWGPFSTRAVRARPSYASSLPPSSDRPAGRLLSHPF